MILESHKNWFQNERGITGETLEAFGVESTSEEWIRLPYETGDRTCKMIGQREFLEALGVVGRPQIEGDQHRGLAACGALEHPARDLPDFDHQLSPPSPRLRLTGREGTTVEMACL